MFLKKNVRRILLILGMITLVGVVFYSVGRLKFHKPIQGLGVMKYKTFKTQNPALDFTFEYPSRGWSFEESQGRMEKYDVVYLRGPVDKDKKSGTLIYVTVRPMGVDKSASALLESYLGIDSNLDEFKMLRKETVTVAREKASAALYQYKTIPSVRIEDPLVLFKKRMIFSIRNDRSYELTLITSAAQYDICAPVFEHVLKTFKFKE